jgi:hypothetical protein
MIQKDSRTKGEDMTADAVDDLRPLLTTMTADAEARGMVVCPQLLGFPDREKAPYPFLEWEGTDRDYVTLAETAGVRVFYAGGLPFDRDDELSRRVSKYGYWEEDDSEEDPEGKPAEKSTILFEGSAPWALDRLKKRTRQWKDRDGELLMIQCVWFSDGVAHVWQRDADWYDDFNEAVERVVEETQTLNSERAWTASKKTKERIIARALELAHHPRFRDATSEAKRSFLAQQVFPDAVGRELDVIPDEAMLQYWWEIEPEIQKANAEKVWRLHQAGESLATIAATVGISAPKVKAILLADA